MVAPDPPRRDAISAGWPPLHLLSPSRGPSTQFLLRQVPDAKSSPLPQARPTSAAKAEGDESAPQGMMGEVRLLGGRAWGRAAPSAFLRRRRQPIRPLTPKTGAANAEPPAGVVIGHPAGRETMAATDSQREGSCNSPRGLFCVHSTTRNRHESANQSCVSPRLWQAGYRIWPPGLA
jgi:hypothetical protein